MHSLEQAVEFLLGLVRDPPRPYLERAELPAAPITRLLARVGDPHRHTALIHVAGSKGKGSTVLFAEAILTQAGFRTGAFTSPHLQRWTERFRIGGEEVSDAAMCRVVEQLRPHIEALCAEDLSQAPSFFDALTAAAFLQFRSAHCDIGLLEAGLGGRLDATNVATPKVCCITSVELEHTDKLGTSVEVIAGEKAGIIKPGVPVVVGKLVGPARDVVLDRARAAQAPVYELGEEIGLDHEKLDGFSQRIRVDFEDRSLSTSLGQPGRHMAENAALAFACVRLFSRQDPDGLEAAARHAFAGVRLPGRFECLAREPMVIADGAHTFLSMQALATQLQGLDANEHHFVISVSKGKQAYELLKPIEAMAARIIVTSAEPQRSLPADEFARSLQDRGFQAPLMVEPDPVAALHQAYAAMATPDLLCVTGSMYMAGLARTVFRADEQQPNREQSPLAPGQKE